MHKCHFLRISLFVCKCPDLSYQCISIIMQHHCHGWGLKTRISAVRVFKLIWRLHCMFSFPFFLLQEPKFFSQFFIVLHSPDTVAVAQVCWLGFAASPSSSNNQPCCGDWILNFGVRLLHPHLLVEAVHSVLVLGLSVALVVIVIDAGKGNLPCAGGSWPAQLFQQSLSLGAGGSAPVNQASHLFRPRSDRGASGGVLSVAGCLIIIYKIWGRTWPPYGLVWKEGEIIFVVISANLRRRGRLELLHIANSSSSLSSEVCLLWEVKSHKEEKRNNHLASPSCPDCARSSQPGCLRRKKTESARIREDCRRC